MNKEDKKTGSEDVAKRDFRKGNINFDFLQPEDRHFTKNKIPLQEERRNTQREGKRGLFNRGRPPRPVSTIQTLSWAVLFFTALVFIVWIIIFGESIIWLLALPVTLASLLWSLIMLALFKARPR